MTTTAMAAGRAAPAPGRRSLGAILEPWTYVGPAVVLIALVMVLPLVVGLSYAFQQAHILNKSQLNWVGLQNFRTLFADRVFWLALGNTFYWTFASLALQFGFGLALALLLNRPFYGKRVIQAIVFVPWAVPTFLSGLTWAWLFNPIVGPIPHWLFDLGLMDEPYNILGDPRFAMLGPIVANVWFGVPFFAITLLAALQSIPDELYEAAAIDGAGAWQQFVMITLPFLAPMIAVTVLLRTIWISNFADLIVVMTNGGPANTTQILPSYIFTVAYRKLDFGYASAVATALLLLLMLYAGILYRLRQSLRRTT